LLRRWRAGERLTQPHRFHLYQIASRTGMGAAKVAAVYWVMTAWGGLCGIAAGQRFTPLAPLPMSLACVAFSIVPFLAWLFYVAAQAKRAGITRESDTGPSATPR
jgi:UDP-GlcNAc:undecaprenyl-phosphate GlcNAc-1-phosphate transferase